MKANLALAVRMIALVIVLMLIVGTIAFPLVFSSAVVANFLRIVELLSAAG